MPDYLDPLGRADLAALDIPEPWAYGIADKVRFYELDALNHVNNVAYLRWFETLRSPYVRDYGLSGYTAADPQLFVIANAARYLAPMMLGDSYVVTGRTASFRNTSFRMEYGVFRGAELTCTGEAVIVSMTPDGGAKAALPEAVKAAFVARDGAIADG